MSVKRKVVVLGSNSFSGSDFIDLLLGSGETEVTGISRSPEKSAAFLPYKNRRQDKNRRQAPFRFVQADLNRDTEKIVGVIDSIEPEYVVNFAAQSEVAPSWQYPEQWFQTNTVALARLTNALKDRRYLRRYVHISSPEVYGTCEGTVTESAPMNPSSPYAASKAAADLLLSTLVKNFSFPVVTVRSTNVYGAHQQLWKIIPRSVIYLRMGRTIPLHGGGQAVKSYIHIRDVSKGERLIMEGGQPGQIYHLSPDHGYAVRDVVAQICALMRLSFKECTSIVEERLGQDAAYVIDSSRARKELSWTPCISLEQGLSEVIGWVDQNWCEIQHGELEYVHKP